MVETFSYNFWLGWGLLVFSTVLLIVFTRAALIGRRASRWPSLIGRVKEKRLEIASSGGNPGVSYTPIITYSYEVNGETFTSNEYHPSRMRPGYSKEKAQKILDAVGETITVHYNPTKPADAYLFPYPRWVTFCVIPITLFGILWALSIIFS